MKIFSLGSVLALSAVASAALAAPQLESRLRRDVSELLEPAGAAAPVEYLPPGVTEAALLEEPLPVDAAVEPEAEADPEGTVLGGEGYEYRTVRRLKLRHRNRRDVSHLQQQQQAAPARQYLPPSQAYLPPAPPAPAAPAVPAPIDDTEEVVSAAEPKQAPVREYLPPVEVSTEAVPQEETTPVPEEPEADVRVVDVPTNGAGQLLDDGYHYQQPMEMPAELREAAREYLPPLEDEAVVVEGPADGQTAVLTNDGYQYRAVRRYRF